MEDGKPRLPSQQNQGHYDRNLWSPSRVCHFQAGHGAVENVLSSLRLVTLACNSNALGG